MIRVLFVCLGNICRSPMAEGLFTHLVESAELTDQIEVASCGVGDYHVGEPPDPRATREAQRRDIDITSLRGRVIRNDDFYRFDYILCMDHDNLSALRQAAPADARAHVGLLLDFSRGEEGQEIGDPYFGDTDNFEHVADQIRDACVGLLTHLQRTELKS